MRFECDFVIQSLDGKLDIREVRAIDAADLEHAVRWVEDKIASAPGAFKRATAVRLRHNGKVVWLKALNIVSVKEPDTETER